MVHNSQYLINALGQLIPAFCDLLIDGLVNGVAAVATGIYNYIEFLHEIDIKNGVTVKIESQEYLNIPQEGLVRWKSQHLEGGRAMQADYYGIPLELYPREIRPEFDRPEKIKMTPFLTHSKRYRTSTTETEVSNCLAPVGDGFGWIKIGTIQCLGTVVYFNWGSLAITGALVLYKFFSKKKEAPEITHHKEQKKWIGTIEKLDQIHQRAAALELKDINNGIAQKKHLWTKQPSYMNHFLNRLCNSPQLETKKHAKFN